MSVSVSVPVSVSSAISVSLSVSVCLLACLSVCETHHMGVSAYGHKHAPAKTQTVGGCVIRGRDGVAVAIISCGACRHARSWLGRSAADSDIFLR